MALEIDILGEVLDAIFKSLGKYGIWLNANGKRICFVVWGSTEIYWSIIHFHRNLYSQSFFAVVGLGFYIFGYIRWSKKQGDK